MDGDEDTFNDTYYVFKIDQDGLNETPTTYTSWIIASVIWKLMTIER